MIYININHDYRIPEGAFQPRHPDYELISQMLKDGRAITVPVLDFEGNIIATSVELMPCSYEKWKEQLT